MSTSLSTTTLATTENYNSPPILGSGKSFKIAPAFLHWLHAIALFAFAGFVTFSIAGAHISLGLLTLCVAVEWATGRGQRAESVEQGAEGEERRAEGRWQRAEGVEHGAEGEEQKSKSKRQTPKGKDQNASAEVSPYLSWSSIRLGIEGPIVAFVLVGLISTIFSETPFESFRNLRHLLTILGAYTVAVSLRWYPQWRQPLLWTFVGFATAASLYGLGRFALGFTSKVQSAQATTMTWGALCVMFMAVTLQLALVAPARRDRWLARAFSLPQTFALLFSMVRGAYVGFAAGVIYLLRRYWSNRRIMLQRVFPVALVLLVAVTFLPLESVRQRVTAIFDPNVQSTQVRLVQWKHALRIAEDHLIVGTGWRDMLPLIRRYATPDPNLPDPVNHDLFHIGHFHNNYVMILVCFGVVGLAAFSWLLVAVWRQLGATAAAATPQDRLVVSAIRAAMIGFLVAGIFDWTFGDAEVVTMFWFLVGMGLGQSKSKNMEAQKQ